MSNKKTGWIRIHRQIQDNKFWFGEVFTRGQAWIDLLLLANHTAGQYFLRGIEVKVKRGQIGYSEQTLADRWLWSRGKVRRYLTRLESEQQIVQHKSNIISLITVKNYNKYQTDDTADSTASSTADGTTERQQTVQQTDTNKNDKNDKNDKNVSAGKPQDEKWDFQNTLQKMLKDKKRHIVIISGYIKHKQWNIPTSQALSREISRSSRAAVALAGYDYKRIKVVMDWLDSGAYDGKWTLETVEKFINEDLNKLTAGRDPSLAEELRVKAISEKYGLH